jgi:hypothetical protein
VRTAELIAAADGRSAAAVQPGHAMVQTGAMRRWPNRAMSRIDLSRRVSTAWPAPVIPTTQGNAWTRASDGDVELAPTPDTLI